MCASSVSPLSAFNNLRQLLILASGGPGVPSTAVSHFWASAVGIVHHVGRESPGVRGGAVVHIQTSREQVTLQSSGHWLESCFAP